MHFDDRLDTVLSQPPSGKAMVRIQYRQLLDLLGTTVPQASGEALDAAFLRLAELADGIPAVERAAMIQEPGLRLRSPVLVAHLARDEPAVADAVIGKASLTEDQWLDLIPALPAHARGLLRHRRDLDASAEALLDRLGATYRPLPYAKADVGAKPAPPAEEPIAEIGAIVRRIEAFRRTRAQNEASGTHGDTPRLPLDDESYCPPLRPVETFDFTTDVEGRIDWAEPSVAPMVIGFNLPTLGGPGTSVIGQVATGFRYRQPLRGVALTLAGAPSISGNWLIDAVPRFDQLGGGFTGYCGRMRRLVAIEPASAMPAPAIGEADRMRQMLHELRTPVNAIQGFAEVLLYQLYGPTPQEYRALAATIASDAARILAGFDELDRLVRLDSGALRLDPGKADLGSLLDVLLVRLMPVLEPRQSAFALTLDEDLNVAMGRDDTERLLWRLLATLASATAPGEILRLRGRKRDGTVRLTMRLPASLATRDDEALLRGSVPATGQTLSAGMFGIGFALRLAAAEARAAGGTLERRGERLRLSLPALTDSADGNSHLGNGAKGAGVA